MTSLGSRDANRVTDKKWRGEQGGVLTVLRDPGALECYERVLVGLLDCVYRTSIPGNLSNGCPLRTTAFDGDIFHLFPDNYICNY